VSKGSGESGMTRGTGSGTRGEINEYYQAA
jgi:hypothetical protein